MRPTQAGLAAIFMAALTLASAATSGNNLLYLVYSAIAGALLVSWLAGRHNLSAIEIETALPEQIFQGAEFPLTLRLRRRGRLPSFFLRARWGQRERFVERLDAQAPAETSLRLSLPGRGVHRIESLRLESDFPLGLFRHSRELPPVAATAYPRLREIRDPREVSSVAERGGETSLRKGGGDEFFGAREYTVFDDYRWINWKLSAKQGRPLVTEFAEPVGSKIVVRLMSTANSRVEEAASACRFFVDAGAEVRLVTPEGEEPFGKGLLHLDRLLRALALVGEGKTPKPAAADAPPSPPGTDERLLRRVTVAGAALVFVSLFLVDEIPPSFLFALAPLLAVGAWLQERDGPWLPQPFWNAISTAVLAYVLLMDWGFSGIILTNTHLVLYLMVNRVLNPIRGDSLRQTFIILFLAFFLVSGQTISLWYIPAFLLFAAFAIARLAGTAGARGEAWRRWAPAIAACWAASLVVSAFVFAATPRFDTWYQRNPLASLGLDKLRADSNAVSGFTEDVTLGFFGSLRQSAARVMRVKPVVVPNGTPPSLYIRGSAFDAFDGRRWRKTKTDFRYRLGDTLYPSLRGRAWLPRQGDRVRLPAPAGLTPNVQLDFTVYPLNTSVLFTVGRPLTVENVDDTLGFDPTDSVYFNAPHLTGIRYRLLATEAVSGFGDRIEAYPALVRERFLQVPDNVSPRMTELARRLTAQAGDDRAKVRAVQAYLRSNLSYSLYSKDRNTDLDQFLFSVKKGNCEYFASAEAILLRLAGVPTRLVAGFLAQDWNEFGSFYDVRQSQAHAWVEAYVNGDWMLSDPTPPDTGSFLQNDVFNRLSRLFNAAQARWYQNVIGYDTYVQRNTFYRMGLGSVKAALEKLIQFALYGSVLAAIGLALWGLWGWAVKRVKTPASPFLRAQAALERAGLPRELSQTPREFARSVASARPGLAPINDLAESYYLEVYAGRQASSDERKRDERTLQDLIAKI